MSKLLIHVGFHKTGTTWLQDRIFNQKDSGFSVIGHNSKEFARNFIYGHKLYQNSFTFNPTTVKQEFDNALKDQCISNNSVVVLSDEDLIGHMWSGGSMGRRIADDLRAVFPNAKILITIREQLSAIASSFFHFRSAGGVCSISDYLKVNNEFQVSLFNPLFYDYLPAYNYYCSIFGDTNVKVMPLEFLQSSSETYIKELFEFVELPLFYPESAIKRENETNTKLFVWYNRFPMNGLFRYSRNLSGRINLVPKRFRYRVGLIVMKVFGFLSLLTSESKAMKSKRKMLRQIGRYLESQTIADRFKRSNTELQKMTGLPLGKYGYLTSDK